MTRRANQKSFSHEVSPAATPLKQASAVLPTFPRFMGARFLDSRGKCAVSIFGLVDPDCARTDIECCLFKPSPLLVRLRRIILKQLGHNLFQVLVILVRVFLEVDGLTGISAPDQVFSCGIIQVHR
jgi:hypothetical protein